ncbi:MAG: RNA polymerase sigma factor [Dehalococcoidia bacterium]
MSVENTIELRRGGSAGGAAYWDGSRAAYRETFLKAYELYYTKVFAYIYSRTSNVELTKDLAAEVFEKAYAKGSSVREPAAYVTWLFMVAKNVVVGHYRKQKRETRSLDRVKETVSLQESWAVDPEESALKSEAVSLMVAKLRVLSHRDQELLALKFDGELTYPEISRVLGLSEVNVRVSIFRALKRLRRLVEADDASSDRIESASGKRGAV